MSKIIEASELPENEKVYLKKDWFGWRVVEPYKDENGKTNWKRFLFGTKKTLITLIIYLLIAVMLYVGIKQLIAGYADIANNPCKYCIDCFKKDVIPISNLSWR